MSLTDSHTDVCDEGLNNLLAAYPDKSAYALCIFTYSEGTFQSFLQQKRGVRSLSAGPGKPIEIFEGRCDGVIVPARGPALFGWDPVFQPTPGNQT